MIEWESMKTKTLIAAAMLAALAFILQIGNGILGIPTGFGMTVDLVAVPILLAFFVLGYEAAFYSLGLLGLFILFTSPTGYIGAIMKIAATLPMFMVPVIMKRRDLLTISSLIILLLIPVVAIQYSVYLSYISGLITIAGIILVGYMLKKTKKIELSNTTMALFALAAAVILRGVFMIIINLYFAGPLFFNLTPGEFMGFLDSVDFIGLGAGWGAYLIFIWNVVQGTIEFGIAWILAYKYGFAERYG